MFVYLVSIKKIILRERFYGAKARNLTSLISGDFLHRIIVSPVVKLSHLRSDEGSHFFADSFIRFRQKR
ncbi:hypothetical protein MSMAS_1706 [Methanosarcina mazei S-6]|jgi:hypothetical protein|uniref:Uncharacterized protein n=1 Tax=Methanosarcina mazei S-6 TaxID=213585 RepID=A0A0E3RGC5_METMZ|nr:hypothetical protein MSMAS_1706 [Methanosarcina mazei S-6]